MKTEEKFESAADHQVLTFMLRNQIFGIDILNVKEILEYGVITPIPLVPDYIKRVLNLRGNVVPVIDLQSRFGHGNASPSKLTCIVIVEIKSGSERMELGIMVDSVNEVSSLSEKDIEPPPNFGANIRLDFISSIGKKSDKFVILLNVDNVLSIAELSQLQEATNSHAS